MAFYNLFFNRRHHCLKGIHYRYFSMRRMLLCFSKSFEILGSVAERAQQMSCSTSRRLRCLNFIHTSPKNADSHSHVQGPPYLWQHTFYGDS